jgi:hypothetical protein
MLLATKGQGCLIRRISRVVRLVGVLGVCLSGSSCLPLRFNASPGASGVVLDSESRSPLAGAEVVVSKMIYPPPSADEAFTNSRPPVITTDSEGHFSIPADRRWDIFVIPIDLFPRFGLLVIKRDGYESAALPFWSRSVTDIGEVAMKPVKK